MLDHGNPLRGDGWAATRPDNENPKDPRCKLHLQRICGTCQHYQGALRPDRIGYRPRPQDGADCAYFKVKKSRTARAWNCRRWARKSGGGDK